MALLRRRLLVSGEVQGVFFRDRCRREAMAAGLAGWARNLPDGRVEVVAEGEPEAVERLQRWCRQGSSQAEVTSVEALDEEPEGLSGFSTC
ncbi:MAG: acylphosphatase [Actinobacteria bacterium]|nr:acylphosphatase [Actinomycetota bacterium]